MPATVHVIAGPRVTLGVSRASVTIGSGKSRVVLSASPAVTLQGSSARVTLSPAPRTVVVGGNQGIAGPPGTIGATGGLDLATHFGTMDTADVLIDGGLL